MCRSEGCVASTAVVTLDSCHISSCSHMTAPTIPWTEKPGPRAAFALSPCSFSPARCWCEAASSGRQGVKVGQGVGLGLLQHRRRPRTALLNHVVRRVIHGGPVTASLPRNTCKKTLSTRRLSCQEPVSHMQSRIRWTTQYCHAAP